MSKSRLFSSRCLHLSTMTTLAFVLALHAQPSLAQQAAQQTTPPVDLAVQFIAKHEQCKETSYRDAAGHRTIGYGFKNHKASRMSCGQAKLILYQKVRELDREVSKTIDIPLTNNQKAALISLTYNIGVPRFNHSSVKKHINNGNWNRAKKSWLTFTSAKGRTLRGLIVRRKEETSLF